MKCYKEITGNSMSIEQIGVDIALIYSDRADKKIKTGFS